MGEQETDPLSDEEEAALRVLSVAVIEGDLVASPCHGIAQLDPLAGRQTHPPTLEELSHAEKIVANDPSQLAQIGEEYAIHAQRIRREIAGFAVAQEMPPAAEARRLIRAFSLTHGKAVEFLERAAHIPSKDRAKHSYLVGLMYFYQRRGELAVKALESTREATKVPRERAKASVASGRVFLVQPTTEAALETALASFRAAFSMYDPSAPPDPLLVAAGCYSAQLEEELGRPEEAIPIWRVLAEVPASSLSHVVRHAKKSVKRLEDHGD